MSRAGALLLLLGVLGCGASPRRSTPAPAPAPAPAAATTPPAAAAPPEEPLAAAVEASVTLYEALAAVDREPCDRAGSRAAALVAERTGALATVRDAARSPRRTDVDALFERAAPRLSAAVARIDALVARCPDERALADALAAVAGPS